MKTATLTPAYGRDYKTATAALADFDAGKDFILTEWGSPWDGKPVNKEQLSGYAVRFRFARLTRISKEYRL